MVDSIVVAVTGAPVAVRAVRWAVQRAQAAPPGSQRIELLSVVGGVLGTVGEAAVLEQAVAATETLLERLAEPVRDAGIPVVCRAEAGDPVSRLIDASAEAALLVIGSDYRGPGAGPARGAHGIRIAAGAACPVVVVPDVELVGRSGVVVGIDGSPVSEHALRFAAREADRLGESLTAVSVWTPLEAPRNGLAVYPEMYLANMQAATEEMQAVALAGLAVDFPDPMPAPVLRSELGLDAQAVIVGSVGVLRREKGHEQLIEAMLPLLERDPDLHLVIVGGGDAALAALQAQITVAGLAGRVHLLGTRSDVPALLPDFDIFALATHIEASGTAFVEAGAAGLPVIGTRVGGVPEMMQENESGLLVPLFDIPALTEALDRLISDPDLRRRMGRAGRRYCLEDGRFTREALGERTERCYRQWLEELV